MKSKEPKIKGLEKAKQYLESLISPESVLILPTGERVPTNPDTLKDDVDKYIEDDLSNLDHLVAVDKEEEPKIVLLPIVESG